VVFRHDQARWGTPGKRKRRRSKPESRTW
jgi:hypothetical protein